MTFEERASAAEAKLRAGYDPEAENGAAVRSDAWGLALGWTDRLKEELREMTEKKLRRFQDVPQLTSPGNWECDYDLQGAWENIERWTREAQPRVDLNPDFQRAHVWTEAQQIAWIEFFLRGGKTGRVLYFNCPGWMRNFRGPIEIVDGKQRLEAIRRFLHNEIPVFGSFFREYTDRLRLSQTIKINMNDLPTRAAVLQWYIEFNAGGTPHTDEEIERVRALLEAERMLAAEAK